MAPVLSIGKFALRECGKPGICRRRTKKNRCLRGIWFSRQRKRHKASSAHCRTVPAQQGYGEQSSGIHQREELKSQRCSSRLSRSEDGLSRLSQRRVLL